MSFYTLSTYKFSVLQPVEVCVDGEEVGYLFTN